MSHHRHAASRPVSGVHALKSHFGAPATSFWRPRRTLQRCTRHRKGTDIGAQARFIVRYYLHASGTSLSLLLARSVGRALFQLLLVAGLPVTSKGTCAMPFDVDNDVLVPPPRDAEQPPVDVPMSPMSDYLALLRRSGKVEDPESGGKPSMPLNRAALAAMRERMAVVERQSRPGGELLSPRELPWLLAGRHAHPAARGAVIMKVTGVGIKEVFVIGGLTPTSTVQVLIDHVHRRLQPGPSSQIIVEHYGRVLPPERTLAQCSLQDDAKLGVRVVERRPMGDRGLRRLRVVCGALHAHHHH